MLDDVKKLKKLILGQKLLSDADLKKYQKEAKKHKKGLKDFLIEQSVVEETVLYEAWAKQADLPYINLKDHTIRKDILNLIPEPIASTHQIIAYDKDDITLKVATVDPEDLQTFEFIRRKTELELEISLTDSSSIREGLKQYHKSLQAEFADITKKEEKIADDDKDKLTELAQDLPVIRIVDTLLEYAIFENASDIHIEPAEKEVVARYRIDGILRDVMTMPRKIHPGLVARIKILANLKLDEHRLPQDGRFKIQNNEYKISFRVSIIPVFDGEKIVMRLLNESAQILTLEQLGFQQRALDSIQRSIKKPNGMILVTGPTGSGKTTTLYTVLNILNTPEVNITTVEDPIEYRMPRLNQSQVNHKIGYTFAAGLRAFLRQDPDIIMVGEIRDNETADIAVNAAMTGHLVLSTLHTNDAPTALPRLMDMDILPFLVASTVNVIIAQRLLRRICPHCIVSYNLDQRAEKDLEKQFNIPEMMKALAALGEVVSGNEKVGSLLFYKGKGCKKCGETGYKGRVGIYEVLEMTPEISDLVMNNASADTLMKKAIERGMITMAQDGFIKAKNGITTLEEILRVTKE